MMCSVSGCPDLPRGYGVSRAPEPPVEAAVETHLKPDARLRHRRERAIYLRQLATDRLLAEDVLLGGGSGLNQRRVGVRRCANGDGIQPRIGEEMLVVLVHSIQPALLGAGLRRRPVDIANGGEFRALDPERQVLRVQASHQPRPDHAHAQPAGAHG